MNIRFKDHSIFKTALGVAATVLCGLLLWRTPMGDAWVNSSYDYLFRFGARPVTNKVVLIFMDNEAIDYHGQVRDKPWDRALHARLLNKLADEGCPLVVLDTLFRSRGERGADEALAKAIRRLPRVVLMADQAEAEHPAFQSVRPVLPSEPFLSAANNNWGVAGLNPDLDLIVRKHWPFVAAGEQFYSLPWAAAKLVKTNLNEVPPARWLRYYGAKGAWVGLSYPYAFEQAPNYFSDKFVFIGNKPKTPVPGDEADEFRTPYTRWTDESSGGVEILATAFLNLLNHEWLCRANSWVEASALIIIGALLGGGLCRVKWVMACGIAAGAGLALIISAICVSYFTNYWFPWLVVVGGQIPCALVCGLVWSRGFRVKVGPGGTDVLSPGEREAVPGEIPRIPDYECFHKLGEGGFGEVWLVRSAIQQWQALKIVYRAKFEGKPEDRRFYDMEYEGVKKYKPVSEGHRGLLRIEFISGRKREGYFYYVMELGDAQVPGWEENPADYKAWTLLRLKEQGKEGRVSVIESLRIGLALSEALRFLHEEGLTHRDIKPSNVIFVNGLAKLADVGLVTKARLPQDTGTIFRPFDFMVPASEAQGTVQADIYSLGKVLYFISTGQDPLAFPSLPTSVVEEPGFMALNEIICKACQQPRHRYTSAAEMHDALQAAHQVFERNE